MACLESESLFVCNHLAVHIPGASVSLRLQQVFLSLQIVAWHCSCFQSLAPYILLGTTADPAATIDANSKVEDILMLSWSSALPRLQTWSVFLPFETLTMLPNHCRLQSCLLRHMHSSSSCNLTALMPERRLSSAGLLGGAKASADHWHHWSRQKCDHLWGT